MSGNDDKGAPRVELAEAVPENCQGLERDLAALAIKHGLPCGVLVAVHPDRVETLPFATHPNMERAVDWLAEKILSEMDGGTLCPELGTLSQH